MFKKAGRCWQKSVMGLVLTAVFCLAFLGPALAADPVKLRYTTYNPPRGMEGLMDEWLTQEITKRSNGQIEFENYFGGSLLTARETLKGLQAGTADMGFIFVPYFPKELPIWSVAEPFILGPVDPKKRADFIWALYAEIPELEKTLTKWNQKLVAVHVYGKHSVGGPRTLKSLADLKGLKVRCSGGPDALNMSALGANIVFLKGTEVYSAMQKGAVDANHTVLTSYFKYKLYEIGGQKHHLLVIPRFVGSVAIITMNLDVFNKLSPELQEMVLQVGKEYSELESQKILELEDEYSKKMAEAGCNIVQVSKDEVVKWAEIAEGESKAKWVEKYPDKAEGEKAIEKAAEILQRFQD